MVEISKIGRQRLSIITSPAQSMSLTTRTVVTAGTYDTHRKRHVNKTGKRVRNLQLVYANYGKATQTEAPNANTIRVKAALEFEGTKSDQTAARVPVYFNGMRAPTIDPGALLYSDPCAYVMEPEATLYERIGVTVLTNNHVYWVDANLAGGTTGYGADTGEGVQTTTDQVSDGAGNTAIGTGNCYGASVLLGELEDGTVAPSLAILGDSIPNGSDDAELSRTTRGWALRAFDDYPAALLTIGGEAISAVVSLKTFYSRFQLAFHATHVLCAYGRNDVTNGRTTAQIKADILAFARRFMARGQHFIQATILPATTSSDGWFTASNQTKEANDATRVAVNQWIRDTSASGFVAQANAQVAALLSTGISVGAARALDTAAAIECNSAGVLTQDGGYILGSQGSKLVTGTATGATSTTLVDSGKSWTANQFKGKSVYISGGTGAGQVACIAFNDATTLTLFAGFPVTPSSGSTYEIFDAVGLHQNVHPTSTGHRLIAESIDADAIMLG